jgi:hypothetical protein
MLAAPTIVINGFVVIWLHLRKGGRVMVYDVDIPNTPCLIPLTLDEQAELAAKHGLETLLFCPDSWALRHGFVNHDTGESARARCNRWDCLYCEPRKVDQWRQLVKEAAPTLFLTLTKAGKTVEEAARALTTFLQYLRRGSKGRGPHHKGAREAYPIEYFAVLERHSNFAENGFHWHLLVKGVEFIPHEALKAAWSSARHGEADIVWIEAIRKPQVIGYVTKYLTKSLSLGEKGVRYEEHEMTAIGPDKEGHVIEERYTTTVEMVSKAIMTLVAREPDDRAAGQLIEMWVKGALFNCLIWVAGRASLYDGFMRLLAWDLAGSALAYADWDGLVALLTGRRQASENLFTLTLYHFIMSNAVLQAILQEMLHAVPDAYICADAMKDWFREQVDTLFDGVEVVLQQPVISALVAELLQNTYILIAWEHVARTFRPDY